MKNNYQYNLSAYTETSVNNVRLLWNRLMLFLLTVTNLDFKMYFVAFTISLQRYSINFVALVPREKPFAMNFNNVTLVQTC